MQRHLKQLCQSRFEVIHLHLDLTQAAAVTLVPACESWGFFFAGILPGLGQTQILILQYLNNVPLDYDKILLYSPQARELLEYIKPQIPIVLSYILKCRWHWRLACAILFHLTLLRLRLALYHSGSSQKILV